jgi:Predicted integral membrane protein (DUF2269)
VALAVHIATSVSGFGTLALTGVYAGWGRHVGTGQELEDLRRYFASRRRWSGVSLWLVPLAGGIALGLRDDPGALLAPWVFAATGCWAVAVALAVRVIWPAQSRIRDLVGGIDPPATGSTLPGRADLDHLCRHLARAAAVCDVAFTITFVLMVFEP